ncbi:hypothetical protein BZA77DRAFT_329745 [Pyronema omphalodes]|nr:hypothetical protein BZA77DRAFT_329745 [Pyronema omphalodes]
MASATPRKRDRLRFRLRSLFKSSEALKDESPKETKVRNTGDPWTNPSTATSIIKTQSLWSTALNSDEIDSRERKTLKDIDFQANAVDSVSKARSAAEKRLQEKKEKYPKVQKLISCMDWFKEIGDIVVQYDPVHAALPWAGVRLLLKLCVDRQKTLDAILDGLDMIAGVINRCTVYELLYLREDSDASKHLENSMLRLYIAILKFLAKAVDRMKENEFKATFTMQNIAEDLQRLHSLEKTVTSDASVAQAKSTRSDLQDLRTRLENMNNTISDIQPQLDNIQNWLEECDRSSILQWISEIPYTKHHKRISEERLEGTGQWLFERHEYKSWISSNDSKLLLLRGIRKSPYGSLIHIILVLPTTQLFSWSR